MPPSYNSHTKNRLLAALPSKERGRLLARCEHVALTIPDVLCESGKRIRQVYFPVDSIISLRTHVSGGASPEVGLVGNEGMFGTSLALGVDISPVQALVRGSGSAWRLEAATFRQELDNSVTIRRTLNRYIHVLIIQLTQTATCAGFHHVEARLARSLLMTQDRAHADNFHLTHELIAHMLGVRRVGITKAAGLLQKRKLITYNRGHITILDTQGLEAVSCGCYRADIETYEHMLA